VATRDDVERLAAANRRVRLLALRELRQIWDFADPSDAVAIRALVDEAMPSLVAKYGDVAATVAADFYDEMRLQAGVPGTFTARLSSPAPAEAVVKSSRWAIGPVFSETPDGEKALGRLVQVLDRKALQQGRDTIVASASMDPSRVGWARVPSGAETCAFCLTMASRGAVYTSKVRASVVGPGPGRGRPRGYIPSGYGSGGGGSRRPPGEAYHADCDCTATPIWSGQPYPDGYDPDALYQTYRQARDEAGSGDLREILSKLRETQGIN